MAYQRRRPCTHAGCNVLVEGGGRCPAHEKKEKQDLDKRRGTASQRGYTAAWDKARRYFLASHPLCVDCLAAGRTVPATVVDHIVPHKGDLVLFWERKNWQSLCKQHHDSKTAREDGRWEPRTW